MKTPYIIEVRKDETTIYNLSNLNQVYGLLVGQIGSFQEIFHSAVAFRSWFKRQRRKTSTAKITHAMVDHSSLVNFSIERR